LTIQWNVTFLPINWRITATSGFFGVTYRSLYCTRPVITPQMTSQLLSSRWLDSVGVRDGQPRNFSLTIGRSKRFSFLLQCQNRHWGPQNLLLNANVGLFVRVQRTEPKGDHSGTPIVEISNRWS
jgi:hypothetical protein